MQICLDELTTEALNHEIEKLEDSYAEALKDDIDVSSLSALWAHIKKLKKELADKVNSEL